MKIRTILMTFLITTTLFACSRPQNQQGSDGKPGNASRSLIQNKGSDTLVNVAQAWAENYRNVDSSVGVAVAGGGSGTGISALLNGTVDIANSSRKLKQKELDAAKAKGIDPVEHIVGFDALAIFVHPSNPIESITIEQLASIYGDGGAVEAWGQIDLSIPGTKDDKIIRVSRQNNSGTYAYFKKAVLGKGKEYKLGSLDMHGSKDVVDLVAKTPGAIGYSGLAYAIPEVKMVPVIGADGKSVVPSTQTAASGAYPIARPLLMYTVGQPKGKVKKYMDWILSAEGQGIIAAKGYAPAKAIKW
jgi:phosphate transport system substrate-binding protein